jgi:hypothetical protein
MLSTEEKKWVESMNPHEYSRWTPPDDAMYGKPTGQLAEYGKPAPNQPGTILRAGLGNTPASRRVPAALNKAAVKAALKRQKVELKDQFDRMKIAAGSMIARAATKKDIVSLAMGMKNNGEQESVNAAKRNLVESMDPIDPALTGKARKKAIEAERELGRLREEGVGVAISTGFERNGIWYPNKNRISTSIRARGGRPRVPSFKESLDTGEARAKSWAKSLDPLKRIEARKDLKYAADMRKTLKWVEDNWDDPTFQ